MIGRGVTERAISRSDGKLIGLLGWRRRARVGSGRRELAVACRSAARIRWVSRSALVSGPTPPGTGVMADATSTRRGEVHVADDPPIDQVDPDIDDDRAGLEHRTGDETGPAGRHDHDVGTTDVAGQVARPRVADGDRRVLLDQQERGRHADHGRTADDGRVAARDLDPGAAQDLDRGVRGGRQEPVVAEPQEAGIERVDAVDVLGRVDGVDDRRAAGWSAAAASGR